LGNLQSWTHSSHTRTAKANGTRAGLSLEEYYKRLRNTNILIPKMRNEKIDGDNATIEIKIEGPITGWYTIPFIKENGEWKIATAERMKDMKFSKD
jgi:hypothetical protein